VTSIGDPAHRHHVDALPRSPGATAPGPRRRRATPLRLLLWAWPSLQVAAAGPVVPPEPIDEIVVTAPEPRFVAPTTRDQIGRIWAPVLINGRGPYRMVLDTGASRSAVTRRVAEELELPIEPAAVRLRGVTGAAVADAVKVKTVEVGELLLRNERMPIVADAFGGAHGVLGGEGLGDKRIVIEFLRDRIRIARSKREQAPPGYSVLPFQHQPNQGMRIDVMIGPVRAVALIDTGAQVTVGNLALREALARRRGERDPFDDAIIGVTEDVQEAARIRIPSVVAGDLIVRNASIMFSDLYIFDHWRLRAEPALLIGMDVLGVLDTLIIDYRRSELQIRIRG
jgi:predicted aspartyl protease